MEETATSISFVSTISLIGSLCTSTSNNERSISSGFQPCDIVRLPCGSRSTSSTRRPCSASATPRLRVVVVFATPPFWLAKAITRAIAGPLSAVRACGRESNRVSAVVCVAVFMLLLDITVVNVALPNIEKELHTSFTDLQWVVDAYALTLAATMLNAGSLGDLLGRKRVFLVAIGLFTIASTLCGAAQSPAWLIIARGAQGIGGAGMFAVSLAIISQEFHGRERGTAFGIWGATVGLAVAIGPLVGGALTTYVGWRWIFFVNLPIGAACIAAGMRALNETRDEERGGLDLPGLVTLTSGLFALVLGLLRGNDWGWSSGRVVGLFVAAAILLGTFAALELRRREPMLEFRLFRVPTFTGAQITAFAISSGMFAQFLYLAIY